MFRYLFICSFALNSLIRGDTFAQKPVIDSVLSLLAHDKQDSNKVKHLNIVGLKFAYNNPDTSLILSEEALALSKEINWKKGMASSLGNLGICNYFLGNYPKALDYYFKELRINEEEGERALTASALGRIGLVYRDKGDYLKSLDYSFKALRISQELGDERGMASWFGNIGNVYYLQKDYTQALDHYFKAGKIFEEHNMQTDIAANLGNIGVVYNDLKDHVKALDYYSKALRIKEQIGEKNGIAIWMGNIGSLYLRTENFLEAEKYLTGSLLLSDSLGDLEGIKEMNHLLGDLYAKTGDLKKALLHYKRLMEVKDTLYNQSRNDEITRLEMTYEFEKKEAALKAEQERKEALAKADANKKVVIIIILLMLLVVIGLFLNQQRIKRKKDKVIFAQESSLLRMQKQHTEEALENSKAVLADYTKNMLEKIKMLEQFEKEIEQLKNLKSRELYEEKIDNMDLLAKGNILTEEDWEKFKVLFEQVYKGFFTRLKEKLPDLTPAETRLVCLTKLKLSQKEIAGILGVSVQTVRMTRYRLRKKLSLPEDESVEDITASI